MAGMIGHDWPVFNGFKGGRGVSSVYGALLVIDWIGALSWPEAASPSAYSFSETSYWHTLPDCGW